MCERNRHKKQLQVFSQGVYHRGKAFLCREGYIAIALYFDKRIIHHLHGRIAQPKAQHREPNSQKSTGSDSKGQGLFDDFSGLCRGEKVVRQWCYK